MKNIAQKRTKNAIKIAFAYVEKNRFYKKIKNSRLIIRIILSIFFFIWFIIGTILMPPIPFWNISLVLALIILFPIWKVKSKLQYLINKLRIIRIYAKRLSRKQKIKSKFKKL